MCADVVCLENQICRSNQISLVNSNYDGVLAPGGAAVVDNPNAFECICVPGYEPQGMGCVNVDECVTDSHTCVEWAECTDTPGSYECACKSGFEGKAFQTHSLAARLSGLMRIEHGQPHHRCSNNTLSKYKRVSYERRRLPRICTL